MFSVQHHPYGDTCSLWDKTHIPQMLKMPRDLKKRGISRQQIFRGIYRKSRKKRLISRKMGRQQIRKRTRKFPDLNFTSLK